ncbi:Methyltransferase type 11 [Hymenobacter roseosalivarius DSM 11622]|uniref:Methyltransferase type 11 n=1 Tax=Hymenobacter roseosalivarius DSM 11622 TaxID=645990 RepID=A0A1W1USM1_9BACT|nr:class I SAM-dependent methyltransferase [Hymenobacter roseosalivarius]SMB84046.1 Methyltransferase type 11 [Hymenobacter roseosalivarius DSM 11622]
MLHPAIEWFIGWFDSPYYHLLYRDRNEEEAKAFIDALLGHLRVKPNAKLLDLACGKGRHSVYLSQKGYEVTGVDLSPESIAYAQEFAHARLHFHEHDMRNPLPFGSFDFIFNLFTSFGYFAHETENIVALRSAAKALRPGGKMVIDFMNTERTLRELVLEEEKTVSDITFHITRRLDTGFIVKTIRFLDALGQEQQFEERVRALSLDNFEEYFQMAGLRLAEVLGDYQLSPYNEALSPRMIFIVKR